MWIGGVRAIIMDENDRLLLVKQEHSDNSFWLVPGGGIEEGETSTEAVVREVREETGLDVKAGELLWHVEEVSETRGMRFVNYFMTEMIAGEAKLGKDPEFDELEQVLTELCYMTRMEIQGLDKVYPGALKDEFWDIIEKKKANNVYRVRPSKGFGK